MFRVIRPNNLLNEFMDYLWSFIGKDKIHNKWDSIISVEAITSRAYEKSRGYWNKNNYSFFCGKTDIRKDTSIFQTAIREAREEGKIVLHPVYSILIIKKK